MAFGFYGHLFFNLSLLLSWMVEHDCLDTCCIMYLHLFSATEHVSHRKAL